MNEMVADKNDFVQIYTIYFIIIIFLFFSRFFILIPALKLSEKKRFGFPRIENYCVP